MFCLAREVLMYQPVTDLIPNKILWLLGFLTHADYFHKAAASSSVIIFIRCCKISIMCTVSCEPFMIMLFVVSMTSLWLEMCTDDVGQLGCAPLQAVCVHVCMFSCVCVCVRVISAAQGGWLCLRLRGENQFNTVL